MEAESGGCCVRFAVDGFEAVGHRPHRADMGFILEPGGVQGIHGGGVGVRVPKTERPQAHGAFKGRGFRDGRLIVLGGTCHAESFAKLEHFGRELTGVLGDGEFAPFLVESSESFVGECQLDATPKFDIRSLPGEQFVADWQLQLWCPDPRLYGEPVGDELVPAQTVEVEHLGNHPASVSISVTATSPVPLGYRLRLFNEAGAPIGDYLIGAGLASGATHFVDMSTGWVRSGGSVLMGAVADGAPFRIPKRFKGSVRVEPVTGTAVCRPRFSHTYI